jgi:hypothetical protein
MSRPVRERKPLPGNEVEAETVTLASVRVLEEIDRYLGRNSIMDALTDPKRPGLFSPILDHELCKLAQRAIDAVALLRRLVRLCGDKRYEATLPEVGVTTEQRNIRDECEGMTEEESLEVWRAAWIARTKITESRKVNAKLPDHCPKCGGTTSPCRADGDDRWISKKRVAPARLCSACRTVTPNSTGKVVSLFPN